MKILAIVSIAILGYLILSFGEGWGVFWLVMSIFAGLMIYFLHEGVDPDNYEEFAHTKDDAWGCTWVIIAVLVVLMGICWLANFLVII